MHTLEYRNVGMRFGESAVLDDLNLSLREGEFVALVGPSGSGKSTLINLAAGLLRPTSGGVFYRGREITGPAPARAVVFQNYSLLPWLSVRGNISLAVDCVFSRENTAGRQARVDRVIGKVGLTPAQDRRPGQLSGGMRQRVSLARTLAMEPELLLLDEPLGALDALTRSNLQDEISQLVRTAGATVLLITNDVDEALLMADRVIPILPGPGGSRLGQPAEVGFPCPRVRNTLLHDPHVRQLRKDLLGALTSSGAPPSHLVARRLVLPEIQPEDISRLSLFDRLIPGRGPRRPAEIHTERTPPAR